MYIHIHVHVHAHVHVYVHVIHAHNYTYIGCIAQSAASLTNVSIQEFGMSLQLVIKRGLYYMHYNLVLTYQHTSN